MNQTKTIIVDLRKPLDTTSGFVTPLTIAGEDPQVRKKC